MRPLATIESQEIILPTDRLLLWKLFLPAEEILGPVFNFLCIVAKSPGLAGKSRFSMASPANLGHFRASQAAWLFVQEMSLSLCKLSLPGSRHPPADQPKECDTCLDVYFLHNHVCDHPADHWCQLRLYFTHQANSFNDIRDSFNDIHEWVWSVRVGGVVFPGSPFLKLDNYACGTKHLYWYELWFRYIKSSRAYRPAKQGEGMQLWWPRVTTEPGGELRSPGPSCGVRSTVCGVWSTRGGWTRSIIAESAILIAIDFEWDFFKLLLLWLWMFLFLVIMGLGRSGEMLPEKCLHISNIL